MKKQWWLANVLVRKCNITEGNRDIRAIKPPPKSVGGRGVPTEFQLSMRHLTHKNLGFHAKINICLGFRPPMQGARQFQELIRLAIEERPWFSPAHGRGWAIPGHLYHLQCVVFFLFFDTWQYWFSPAHGRSRTKPKQA